MLSLASLIDMFRESDNTTSYSLFDNPWDLVNARTAKKYEDPKAWCNVFFDQVTSKINERIFAPLFSDNGMGAPNASIRILVAMSIIKEGFQLSDETLIEKCDADIVTRRALGLMNLSDSCPSIDTYYLFRRRLCEYETRSGEDLMAKCFEDATRKQALQFCVHGKMVRMDSTLVGSNIAWYSRYEIVHRTFVKEVPGYMDRLNPALRTKAEAFIGENAKQTVYTCDSAAVQKRFAEIGTLIFKIILRLHLKDGLLYRVFNEQYTVSKFKVTPKDRKEISADSVQNPNDPDAEYRKKGDEKVKGFVVNATEAFGQEGAPSLVTSISVKGATSSDQGFLKDAVDGSERVTGGKVEEVYADGGYQSQDNRDITPRTVFTGIQGRPGRFRYEERDGGVYIIDTITGVAHKGEYTKGGLIRIPDDREDAKYKWRYFTKANIESMKARQDTDDLTGEERKRRPNVEELMFQFTFHTRNGKTRYRGLLKHKLWAYASGFWINMRKLARHLNKPVPCMA